MSVFEPVSCADAVSYDQVRLQPATGVPTSGHLIRAATSVVRTASTPDSARATGRKAIYPHFTCERVNIKQVLNECDVSSANDGGISLVRRAKS